MDLVKIVNTIFSSECSVTLVNGRMMLNLGLFTTLIAGLTARTPEVFQNPEQADGEGIRWIEANLF